MTSFSESEERQELRRQVARLASKYGREYFTEQARSGGKTTDLWLEMGKNGYLGINIPEAYGGGGGGIGDIAAVCEELAAQGCPLLMMVVSPAICGTVIARYGTEEQKQRWLPGIADGTGTMAFAITEPDAGTNSHNITTTARRDGDEWVLDGAKVFISNGGIADVNVIVATVDRGLGHLSPLEDLHRHQFPLQPLVQPRHPRRQLLDPHVVVVADVRGGADGLDPVGLGLARHRHTVVGVARPVVDRVEDVAVQVDHGALPSYTHLADLQRCNQPSKVQPHVQAPARAGTPLR